jgi:hypothetical protein
MLKMKGYFQPFIHENEVVELIKGTSFDYFGHVFTSFSTLENFPYDAIVDEWKKAKVQQF